MEPSTITAPPARGRDQHHRVASGGHFASWNGTAPLNALSGDQSRHRLSRARNRCINSTLHIMAVVQLRNDTEGRPYYRRLTNADGVFGTLMVGGIPTNAAQAVSSAAGPRPSGHVRRASEQVSATYLAERDANWNLTIKGR